MGHPLIAIATAIVFLTSTPWVAHSTDESLLPGGQPVILGKVTRITSHSVVVLTRDGESLPIEFDSRTVMDTSMPIGARVRIEFRLLDSGRYLAQRITPLDRNSDAWAALDFRRLLPHRARTRASRASAVAPAVYSASGTGGHASTRADQPARERTTTDAASTEPTTDATTADGATIDAATTDGPTTDATASNASAGSDAAAASADGESGPPTRSALPVILVTSLLMLVGLMLFRRGRRRG